MAPVHYHEGRFPPEERLDWPKLIPLIGPAVAAVARSDGVLAAVPKPRVLFSPMTTQEAVLSSRIEGTQATMSEVLEFEAGHEASSPQRRDDIHEVLNYRAAMHEAERMLEELPLCQRVVREAHRTLLSGVRSVASRLESIGASRAWWRAGPGRDVFGGHACPSSPFGGHIVGDMADKLR